MSWRDQLRAASFRGAPFSVERHETAGGRQGVHHVYPGRNRGFVEDLGRRDNRLSFEAYVIGGEYYTARDALIAALDEPGPGELVHPSLGRLTVSVDPEQPWRLREEPAREGRMARFSLAFVLTDRLPRFPSSLPATDVLAAAASAGVMTAAKTAFEEGFDAEAAGDFVRDAAKADAGFLGEALDTITGGIALAREKVDAVIQKVLGYKAKVDEFIADPFGLASELEDVFDTIDGLIVTRGRIDAAGTSIIAGLLALPAKIDSLIPPLFPGVNAVSAVRRKKNREQLRRLAKRYTAATAVSIISRQSFESIEQAETLRGQVLDLIDEQVTEAADAGEDDAVAALQDLQARFLEDVRARAAEAPRVVTRTLTVATPALVLSYRYHDGLAQEADIIARNRVRHPLVVGPGEISVLSAGAARAAGGANG